jgi:chromosome partitioning protein
MADFRTKLTDQVINEVRNYFKDGVFKTIIPRSVRLGEAPSFGKPGIIYDRASRGAKCYLEVVKEFESRFKTKSEKSDEAPLEKINFTKSQPVGGQGESS